jgi:hypothetical protein
MYILVKTDFENKQTTQISTVINRKGNTSSSYKIDYT